MTNPNSCEVQIERATSVDIPALSQLLSVLFSQEEEFSPDTKAQTSGLAQIIDHPDIGIILLARQNGQIVGMVSLLFTVSTVIGGRVALLEDMVVSSRSRGMGVGAQLLAEAISYANTHGCKRITLLTDQANFVAKRLYIKQGFVVSSMTPMRLFLS